MDKDTIASVMSCLFCEDTTKEHYIFYNSLKVILDTDEVIDEVYLIYSAIDTLYDLYSLRRDIPRINKEIILSIINNSLYAEVKEVYDPGFRTYSQQYLGVELDSLNDNTVVQVSSHVFNRCEEFIDSLILKNHTIEESRSFMSNLAQDYVSNISTEVSQIIIHLNNNDSRILSYQYGGWKKFLQKYRIFNGLELPKLLRVVSTLIESKLIISSMATNPLTTMGELIAMKEKFIEYDIPIGSWGENMSVLDGPLRIVPGTYTLIAGVAGVGKTTFGSWLAGNLMSQGIRVMFYSPEISKHMLLISHILPAYIQSKYGFRTTPDQILGRDAVYANHETLSQQARQDLIKAGELSLVESKLFYHIDKHFNSKTMIDEMRSEMIKFDPQVIIFDHTTEVHGDSDLNVVTQQVSGMFEAIKREYPVHILAFCHTGSNFKIPTQDAPIVTDKICNWSKRLEGVADNVVGMFRVGDKLNLFNTKARWTPLFPMWISLNMDREHNWFTFDPNSQIGSRLSVDHITEFIEDQSIYNTEGDDNEDNFSFD